MVTPCRPDPRGRLAPWIFLLLGMLGAAAAHAESPPRKFYVEDIKAAMQAHIAATVDADGVFMLKDDQTGEQLALRFVKIHDPVRQIDGDTYFACTDFTVAAAPEKVYDLDFWLEPAGDKLVVRETRVHKEPRRSMLYGWYKYPRYTFIRDEVVYLY